jgi:hypothetical protein
VITVAGGAFPPFVVGSPNNMIATLDGMPLTITSGSATSFTAITPPHAAGGPFSITVTTAGGATTMASLFSYSNGIMSIPNTAPNTKTTDTEIDVMGVGFAALNFSTTTTGTTPDNTNSHVYLTNGAYNPVIINTVNKTLGETVECVNVLVVSDLELVCALRLATGNLAPIMASKTITTTVASSTTAVTSTGFKTADLGLAVSGTGITPGTYITAVVDSTSATLSAVATTTIGGTITIGPKTVAIGAGAGTTGITHASADFHTGDLGRLVTGVGIPVGTYITAVVDSTSADFSTSVTTTNSQVLTVGNRAPQVADGNYSLTVVSDGRPGVGVAIVAGGATIAVPTYSQSIITSGSVFTVAPY